MEQVKCACDRMVEKKVWNIQRFLKCKTTMKHFVFYQKKCDYVLLEVGIGRQETRCNRSDQKASVSVITSVSMDHMQFLGNTLTEITTGKK